MWKWLSTKGGVEDFAGLGGDVGPDRDDPAALDGDVDVFATIGEIGAADEEVEGHGASLSNGYSTLIPTAAARAEACRPRP
jgi:hypothetical protein